MKLSLIVAQGKPESREIPIRLPQFLIGRDQDCHLRPASPMVSKRHCAVLQREGKAYLRDFESTNGTILNGQPLNGEAQLNEGDEFKVGPLSFTVKLVQTPVDQPTPVPTGVKGGAKPGEPAPESASFEDAFVDELLLDVGGAITDSVPGGSTIMEMPSEELKKALGDVKPEEKKDAKKKFDPVATSNAAKAILDKYMRRPRPGQGGSTEPTK
jgi:pSer/pThr/pTyr-binding forkhead associated (FHA) protein